MSTVPVFAPDGSLGDIPQEKLTAALKAGFKPGVTMKSGDGKLGVIPADRVLDATKSGLQMVPLADQETQHPGFWHALYSDLSGMAKAAPAAVLEAAQVPAPIIRKLGMTPPSDAVIQSAVNAPADWQARKAAGYSVPYRVAAPIAEATGAINVKGAEQAAQQGDVGGVLGHAAATPAMMAATAGIFKGADAIADHPAFQNALAKVQQITPKQAAQVVGGGTGAVAGHGTLSAPGAYYGAKTAGKITEGVLGKERANTPIFGEKPNQAPAERDATALNKPYAGEESQAVPRTGAPVERDATKQNVPYAGEAPPLVEMTNRLAQEIAAKRQAPTFTNADRAQAKALLRDSLQKSTADVVDKVAPDANPSVKAQVDFYLKKGDVAKAEAALDSVAPRSDWPPPQRTAAPTTEEIRARIKSGPGSKSDIADTRALQQEMAQDLEKHGWSAEMEARREFIARNSTGVTKGELTGQQPKPVKYTKTPGIKVGGKEIPAGDSATADLTDFLTRSLDEARKQRGQK